MSFITWIYLVWFLAAASLVMFVVGIVAAICWGIYELVRWIQKRKRDRRALKAAADAGADLVLRQGLRHLEKTGCRVITNNVLWARRIDCQCAVCRDWHARQARPVPSPLLAPEDIQ